MFPTLHRIKKKKIKVHDMKCLVIILFPLGFKNPVYLEKDLTIYNENFFQQKLGSFLPQQTLDTYNHTLSNPGHSQPPTNRNFSGDVPVSVHHQKERVHSFSHSDHSFHVFLPRWGSSDLRSGIPGTSDKSISKTSNLNVLKCLTSDQNFTRHMSSASFTTAPQHFFIFTTTISSFFFFNCCSLFKLFILLLHFKCLYGSLNYLEI